MNDNNNKQNEDNNFNITLLEIQGASCPSF